MARERRFGSVSMELPDAIGGYVLEDAEALGRGAMGMVLKAKHENQSKIAAIKIRPITANDNPGMIERIERDAQALTKLHHQNVLQCFDAGKEGDYLFLALEFIEGDTLAELIEREGGKLEEKRALEILYDCAMGLVAVESAEFVHRDIKPRSIFIADTGEAKLSDISLGIRFEDAEAAHKPGSIGGAAAFISPEQAQGGIRLDIRSDIYTLGAAAYSMLSGTAPFSNDNSEELSDMIVNTEPTALESLNSGVSDKVLNIIKKAMHKNPDKRYQHAEEFAIAIEEAMYGQSRPVTKKLTKPKGNIKTREDDVPEPSLPKPLLVFGILAILLAIIYLIVNN